MSHHPQKRHLLDDGGGGGGTGGPAFVTGLAFGGTGGSSCSRHGGVTAKGIAVGAPGDHFAFAISMGSPELEDDAVALPRAFDCVASLIFSSCIINQVHASFTVANVCFHSCAR